MSGPRADVTFRFIEREFFEEQERLVRNAEIVIGAQAVRTILTKASERRCRAVAEAVLDAVTALHSKPERS